MQGYVFATQVAAAALAPIVDSAQGYPIAGVDIGGGVHAPPAQSVTTTYFAPIRNFSNALQWAYIADGVSTPAVAPSAVSLGLPAPSAITSAWFPPAA